MRKLLFLALVLGFSGVAFYASALSVFDIEFPVPELGNCADKAACKAYCDNSANGEACLAFAQKYGLADELTVAKVEKAEAGGPGGCKGVEECRVYCDDLAHEDECIEFAVTNGFMSKEDAERARKPGPGGCRGRACEAYCQDPAHEEECFEYAVDNGFIPPEEAKRIKEFKNKFKRSEGGPGGCKSEAECRSFCNDPVNIEACLSFAEQQGFVSKEEAARVKKAGFAGGPGGCKGQDECRQYCEDPGHQNECIDFGEKNGFMTKEEAERARKFAGKTGPGGCRGEECRTFCENPANVEQCLEHAAQEGLMPPEDIERARKFLRASQEGGPGGCRGAQCRDYCNDPAHREECFSFAKNQGLLRPEDEANFEVGQKLNKKLEESGGPGGCKSEDECRVYCTDASHAEECVAFAAAHGGIPPEQARAMLKQFTERRLEAHSGFEGDFRPPEDFRRFEEEGRRRFEEFRQLEGQFRGRPEFIGPPQEFPGGPPGGGQGFVGPGGCTAPAECIKYCTEHKEECFSFGPPGVPGARPPEGGIPPGHEFPRIRSDIIHEFRPKDLPEGLEQRPEEERKEFFRRKFEEFRGGPPAGFPGEFPARPPEGFGGSPEGEHQFFEGIGPLEGTPGLLGPFPQPIQLPAPTDTATCPLMPTVDQCPPGERKEISFSSPNCGTYYKCVAETAPAPTPQPTEDPAAHCAAQGGTWDGTTCRLPSTSTPPPTTTTSDPATTCAQQGGSWDGSVCKFPEQHTTPPSSGAPRKGFFASILDFLR